MTGHPELLADGGCYECGGRGYVYDGPCPVCRPAAKRAEAAGATAIAVGNNASEQESDNGNVPPPSLSNPREELREKVEDVARWLHDEYDPIDRSTRWTWPEWEGDEGKRSDGRLTITPRGAQEEYRHAAKCILALVSAPLGGGFSPSRVSQTADAATTDRSTGQDEAATRARETPGHTDLMVTPESIGPWLAQTEAAVVICDFMNWPEDGPAWDDAMTLAKRLRGDQQ